MWGAAAIVLILVAGAILLNNKSKNDDQQQQAQQNADQYGNQTADTTKPDQTNPTKDGTLTEQTTMDTILKGCAPGTDFTQKDANGRFKPTIDLQNKVAVLDTSMGKIEISLYGSDAPKTVQNFVCLIAKGYYNGITFHRVAHGFVIQAGDPTGTGSGGESIYGAKFEDELYADTASYKAGYVKGTVAMANAGPNTNGSQFFIMTSDVSLPNNYTIFGKVSAGLDVVEKIGAVAVKPQLGPEDGSPITPITINKATIK